MPSADLSFLREWFARDVSRSSGCRIRLPILRGASKRRRVLRGPRTRPMAVQPHNSAAPGSEGGEASLSISNELGRNDNGQLAQRAGAAPGCGCGDGVGSNTGADPDRIERRVSAAAPDRYAEEGRASDLRAGR